MNTELQAELDKKDTGDGADGNWIYSAEELAETTIGEGWREVIERDEKSHETQHHTDCIDWRANCVIIWKTSVMQLYCGWLQWAKKW